MISAMLLTATMVALDASFRAYASAAEQASTQAATRMIVNRLLMVIRNSTAHGPLLPNLALVPPVTLDGNVITSNFIDLIDTNGTQLRIEYRNATQELWLIDSTDPILGPIEQPLLGGVTNAQFFAVRRQDDDGVWVLDRATMDITVQPDPDTTVAIETSDSPPIRLIASTMPRKLE